MGKPLTREELCAGLYAFFCWFKTLHETAEKVCASSTPEEEISLWLELSRQARVITDLREDAALRCLPDADRTEEVCMEQLTAQVADMINEKRARIEEIIQKYPALNTLPC